LWRSLWLVLVITGLIYAGLSLAAECEYASGISGTKMAGDRIGALRLSARLFPIERRYRIASALLLGNIALQNDNAQWKAAAVPEIKLALVDDPTSADLLAMLIAFDLSLDRINEAQAYYDRFKRVARRSPLLDWVKAASAADR
jgi:hypothetical protein